ncbi:MAG: response regulator [Deltaproteobacteria bacterium]|nr:response regulator [Deltaproteobacteria bacterium]MBW2362983.1 response regulator [Deltaproteobacteria bacterium]
MNEEASRPRILVVDDEEAILETMTFTFQDDYEVFTSSDARRALDLLDEHAPIAVVLTDQRMPNMSGVEFLREVWQRHPTTVRMILTGFADMEAIIEAINDGHVYSYITKPWEPDHLKQVMKQAADHYALAVENEKLLTHLKHANVYLEAVMDQLDTGALAVDAGSVIQAINKPARDYLALDGDPRGASLDEVLRRHGLDEVGSTLEKLRGDEAVSYEEADVTVADRSYRIRVALHNLADASGETFGRVVLLREISHEPLRRRFEQVLSRVVEADSELRPVLETARAELRGLGDELHELHVDSGGVGELEERLSRTLTAIDNWLDVDDAMAREVYPEAQLLQDRMRVALARWPLPDRLPERVKLLGRSVEAYYESGENPQRPVL